MSWALLFFHGHSPLLLYGFSFSLIWRCNKLSLVRNDVRSVHSTRATICESVLCSVWLLVSKHTAFANAVTTTGIRKNGRTSSQSDDSFSALLSFSFVQAKVGFAYGLPPISRGSFWSTRGARCNSVFGCRPNRKHICVCCLIEGSLFHQQSLRSLVRQG